MPVMPGYRDMRLSYVSCGTSAEYNEHLDAPASGKERRYCSGP